MEIKSETTQVYTYTSSRCTPAQWLAPGRPLLLLLGSGPDVAPRLIRSRSRASCGKEVRPLTVSAVPAIRGATYERRRSSQPAQGVRPQGRPPWPAQAPASRRRAQGRHLRDRARRVRRDPGAERLGQVDARPAALHPAAPRGWRRAHLRTRRLPRASRRPAAREPSLRRGELLQEDVRGREPQLRRALLRHDAPPDAPPDPRAPRPGRLPAGPPRRGDGGPLTRDAAKGRARPRAADEPSRAAPRRADDGTRPAVQAGR